jgi:hypothetical protein
MAYPLNDSTQPLLASAFHFSIPTYSVCEKCFRYPTISLDYYDLSLIDTQAIDATFYQ